MSNQPVNTKATTVLEVVPPALPASASVMTVVIEQPPGSPGSPPHRHSGPVFGYVTEGAIVFELEGQPERVVRAGEAFWEPGGDLIHYQDGNYLTDAWSRFVVVMVCAPGQPMLTPVGAAELEARSGRRAARPA